MFATGDDVQANFGQVASDLNESLALITCKVFGQRGAFLRENLSIRVQDFEVEGRGDDFSMHAPFGA